MKHRPILPIYLTLSTLLRIGWSVAALVTVAFTLRRWLFLLVALLPARRRRLSPGKTLPSTLLLVPLRNEAANLPALFSHLEALAYPANRLDIVLVDDASTDDSPRLCEQQAAQFANWHVLPLSHCQGKAAALNAALGHFKQGELVAVYDADERPEPEALVHLAMSFADPVLGAATGQRKAANSVASAVAAYATYELVVHQLVTAAAKDRLHLAPPVLGSNCVYRRTALEGVGGFRAGALLEDSDLTVRLARAGWRLSYVTKAVSHHAVPATLRAYWQQHTRWAAGFHAVARQHAAATLGARRLPWALRLELVAFALGYLDRVALLTLLFRAVWIQKMASKGSSYRRLLLWALFTPLVQIVLALRQARAPLALWLYLPALPLLMIVDVAMSLVSLVRTLRGKEVNWEGHHVHTN